MGNIVILDENTVNKIAAGEVIERPASVVKELLENSIDAGAGSVSIEIKNGGISYIKVLDNGIGIEKDDVEIAFERHSTSKIRKADDIEETKSMGFRGEALASIAAVSAVQLVTRTGHEQSGIMMEVKGGKTINLKPAGCPAGTCITVRDLFFNTPARFKFLKRDTTEAGYISDIVTRIALGSPQISFRFRSGGSLVFQTPGNNDLLSTIFSIYGRNIAKSVNRISYEDGAIKITGYSGKPEIARSNRNHQSCFVNGRYIRSKLVNSAVDEAYKTFLMKNRYAFIILNIEINPVLTDVNVHPSKMDVKFSNEKEIFKAVYHAVGNSLLQNENGITSPGRTGDKPSVPGSGIKTRPQEFCGINSAGGRNTAESHNNTGIDYVNMQDISGGPQKIRENVQPDFEKAAPSAANENSRMLIPDDYIIIGQAFSTYIFLQHNNEILVIDQHAAHERIRYEELKKRFSGKETISQPLLSVLQLELTYREIKFMEEETVFFNRIGFEYEFFGSNSVILRAVPLYAADGNVREIFTEILDIALKSGRADTDTVADKALYTMACKSAVKANKRLDNIEIRKLMELLSQVENPYTCPHGRPSVIRLSKQDMEKMFKRIV